MRKWAQSVVCVLSAPQYAIHMRNTQCTTHPKASCVYRRSHSLGRAVYRVLCIAYEDRLILRRSAYCVSRIVYCVSRICGAHLPLPDLWQSSDRSLPRFLWRTPPPPTRGSPRTGARPRKAGFHSFFFAATSFQKKRGFAEMRFKSRVRKNSK